MVEVKNNRKKLRLADVGQLMPETFRILQSNDPLRMAGATAFFTTFALPPILIILLQLFSLVFNRNFIGREIFIRLESVLGQSSADLIKQTLRNVFSLGQNWYVILFGFIFLIFVATTLFAVIKNSLDQIWCIKVKTNQGFLFQLKRRAMSAGIILFGGVLFLVGLLIEGIRSFLVSYSSFTSEYLRVIVNEILFAIVVTFWFTALFRYITDGRPGWRSAIAGGVFTAILFTLGKLVLRYMLSLSNIGTIYNTSGSIVLILLFVFYSSLMFYYGGCFVKVLSDYYEEPIEPLPGAFKFETHEIVTDEGSEEPNK